MNRSLEYLLFFITLTCIQCTIQITNKTHVPALCYRCQCYNGKPYSVNCETMDFKEIPEIQKDLKLRWHLKLQGNFIQSIPVFPRLDNLTAISLGFNHVTKIADGAFANLTNLEDLELTYNHLRSYSLNAETFKGPNGQLSSPIQTLNLSHNSLDELPKSVFKYLTNLNSLDLSANSFEDLSPKTASSIAELPNLRILNLSCTKLKRLPPNFLGHFRNLEELDLSCNKFVVVPSEINSVQSLRTLSLSNNRFTIIQANSFTVSLKRLKTLYLMGCHTLFRIENGAFGNLASLDVLWLNDNPQLTNIHPHAFTNEHNPSVPLKELHLENNELQHLSENSLPWREIRVLNLQGNPWSCDCNLEWLIKGVVPVMQRTNFDLTTNVSCAKPPELTGRRMTDRKVQEFNFVCQRYVGAVKQYSFAVIAAIAITSVLLAIGATILSCVLYRKSKAQDWVGNMVKYRKALSEDEEMIASNMQNETS